MKNKFLIFSFIFVMLLFLVSYGTVCEKNGHNYEAKDNNDGTHTLVCVNDPTHTLVEDCSMGEWLVVKAAQEFEEGLEERVCSKCDHKEQRSITPTHEHKLSEWTSIKDATCLEDGEEKRTCEGCEYFEARVVEKLGHDEVKHSAKNPTCSEIGYNEYVTCSRCDYTTYVEIPSTGKHNYSLDWTIDVTPTKESVGSKSHHCLNCDANTDITEIPMLPYTDGLNYVLTNDRSGYVVVGIGECLDEEINISPVYNGLPVKVIRRGAFSNCTFIKKVIIPNSVETMAISIFNGCSSLESITLPIIGAGKEANYYGEDGNTFSLIFASSRSSIYGVFLPESLKEVIITGEVGLVGKRAFAGCSFITSITLPEFTTEIGEEAFYNCDSLTRIVIPNSVISIGSSAFEGCTSLTSIMLPFVGATLNGTENKHFGYIFGASSYSYNARNVPSSLKKVIITGGTSIGEEAFYGCSSLTSIEIPNSVTNIGSSAFYNCTSLEKIVIPNSVTSTGYSVFSNCSSLTSIEIPNSVTSIEQSVFSGCISLTSIRIPDSVTSIGSYAFDGCSSLTSIEIPESVTRIGSSAFDGCSSLTSIEIPNSVTRIEDYAFYNCEALKEIIIPNTVTSIDKKAFYNCTSLEKIVIPNSITSIGDYAFYNCSRLTIYCEASSKPKGWNSDWNFKIASVEWGYKENKSQE